MAGGKWMEPYKLGEMEQKFADLIWEKEPVSSRELTILCEKAFGWKRTTTYTMLKRLCVRGIFVNEHGQVRALMTREDFLAAQGEQFLEEHFEGSLPKFLTAFSHRKRLSEKEIEELKKLGKPFIVLLNSVRPYSDETVRLAKEMAEDYKVSVLPVNCEQLKKDDIFHILERVLKEFPVTELDFYIPKWLEILPPDHWLKAQVIQTAAGLIRNVDHMKDVNAQLPDLENSPIRSISIRSMRMSDGRVELSVEMDESYYYQILSDYVGLPIEGEYQLMQTLGSLARMQREYEKVRNALAQVRLKGYGVVTPERSEIVLDEPQMIRHGNKYGVKMKAEAPSINLIKAHIETEIAPIVGNEQQAQDLIAYIKENAKDGDDGVWKTNIFGKSIEQIVEDGIQAKISQMTEECQMKLQDTLQKIINDSNGGMICIII